MTSFWDAMDDDMFAAYGAEMPYRRKSPSHHCGFDFTDDLPTATCNCGAVATNPYYMEQSAKTPQELWDEAVAYGMALQLDSIQEKLLNDEVIHELLWIIYRDIEPFPNKGRMTINKLSDLLIAILIEGDQK